MRAVSVIVVSRHSGCLLLFLGLHGQRLQSSEYSVWSLRLLQLRLGAEERRDVVHGVCVANDPVEGAEISMKMRISVINAIV